ncbi:RsmB/NOP family class I SAM-dependent RNA methyltransferase [Thioclava sp. F28-4]|uniref:RsmB/NOP family class I SAM-dependent RNA methyltransferase n=1 Tax=Thioclava sp. F28-4 TaxID=1915315 RepID=UPI000996996B|nr:RsmB/NOP family class I SAM-dependent RNA methyltransferase [Thioclava sp. F28-4]OOY02837.1 SAM-dependent methyltransferase [Thioclava sp. F28-4]
MTPAARYAAAIDILDRIQTGEVAERALTNWARGHRFAGSKDRAAIRDHVFDVLRCKASAALAGGGAQGRALVAGLLRLQGTDPATVFTGEGFAPDPLSDEERAALSKPLPDDIAQLDWPDWLRDQLAADLGSDFDDISEAMRARAPVFLRVNLAKADRAEAIAVLAKDGIEAFPHPLAETALELGEGARRIQQAEAYTDGLVELQDAASQAAIASVPIAAGQRVLDYCAGGGGKALALAAACPEAQIAAHDIDAGRMRDLPVRAKRAGTKVAMRAPGDPGTGYDLVVVDAPCSGSGTWRRTPDAKWRLSAARLAELVTLQSEILDVARDLVAPGGRLVYMTCSLLSVENGAQIADFVTRHGCELVSQRQFAPLSGGDGFFVAQLQL